MAVRKANATWRGDLSSGAGEMSTETGAVKGPFSFKSRFEEEQGTNPEELIGAAHAGCFSMAFGKQLSDQGYAPEKVSTEASVTLHAGDDGIAITKIHLTSHAKVPGIDQEQFTSLAEAAKKGCPVSKALAGVEISLDANLSN